MKGLGEGRGRELGAGFEDKRKGVEVRGQGEAAEGGEEAEGGERGEEESMDSDESVEGECGGVWEGMEEGECIVGYY